MNGSGDFSCLPTSCEFQAKGPTSFGDDGLNNCQISEARPGGCDISQKSNFVQDSKKPITLDWPPNDKSKVCNPHQVNINTGPIYKNLVKIPDKIFSQVVTTNIGNPYIIPMDAAEATYQSDSPAITVKREFRMPEFKRPIRGPPARERPWIQCVENSLITDQVRRPLARCCHKRPMPPLVIPLAKFEEMKSKATEKERKQAEIEQWHQDRECLRIKARQRQAKWNYTVESLLERKKQKELGKEELERESNLQLIAQVDQEDKVQSNAQISRAKKLMLYRKGLIRDFHSALGYSKMMQEIEQLNFKSNETDDPELMRKKCLQKMMQVNKTSREKDNISNTLPFGEAMVVQPKKSKPINLKLQAVLKNTENRAKEHAQEKNNELISLQQLADESGLELSKSDKQSKPIQTLSEAICDPNQKAKDQEKRRAELYNAIRENLVTDAYIESHEKEIDRQACEFIDYKRKVDAIQKAKEKQMIEEKVEYHIRKSEAAARVLVQMQKEKQARANVYDDLKGKWESEWTEKEVGHKTARQKVMEKVVSDFEERKLKEASKRCQLDPARQWAREKLVAVENFEQECERTSQRRKKAEEIALFNKAQVCEKKCRESRSIALNNEWDMRNKQAYLDEMKEMKAYAYDCINDWKSKGRSSFPMVHAMKKWDYDSGMYPYLFAEGSLDRRQNQSVTKSAKKAETTSNRLGFSSGGC